MLAYSSIAHAGYLLVAVSAANETAAAGLLFYLLVYTVMNVGAFAVVIAMGHQGEENPQIEDYSGLGERQPLLAVLLTLFLLSLAGFPGTGGFIGKIYLLRGAAEAGLWTLAVLLVITTVLSYYYYLRVAWYAWMRPASATGGLERIILPLPTRLALIGGAAFIVYMGIFPNSTLEWARISVEGISRVGGLLIGAGL
jgi:NADH-quinone oxidoreductase subunit N